MPSPTFLPERRQNAVGPCTGCTGTGRYPGSPSSAPQTPASTGAHRRCDPDLVRPGNRELAVEMVRYFNVFVSAAFVFVRCYLATGDIQLFHQLTSQRPILTPESLLTMAAILRAPAEPPLAFQASMTLLRLTTRLPSGSFAEAGQCL